MKRKSEKSKVQSPSAALPISENGRIEIRDVGGEKELLILGVSRILRFGEEEMAFARRHDELRIKGQRLACVSYASGAIGLRGELEQILFCQKEGKS